MVLYLDKAQNCLENISLITPKDINHANDTDVLSSLRTESLDSYVSHGYKPLASVEIPNSIGICLTSINCQPLETINIPNYLTKISEGISNGGLLLTSKPSKNVLNASLARNMGRVDNNDNNSYQCDESDTNVDENGDSDDNSYSYDGNEDNGNDESENNNNGNNNENEDENGDGDEEEDIYYYDYNDDEDENYEENNNRNKGNKYITLGTYVAHSFIYAESFLTHKFTKKNSVKSFYLLCERQNFF